MRGMKDFLQDSRAGMIDYILVVSTPVSDTYGPQSGSTDDKYERQNAISALQQRSLAMPTLDREAIPLLPHLLDVPRYLAVITSAVIRSSKGQQYRRKPSELIDGTLECFVAKCFEVEEIALQRVSQLASQVSETHASKRHSSSQITARYRKPSMSSKSPTSNYKPRRLTRPITAPSQSDLSDFSRGLSDSSPSSPVSNAIVVPRLKAKASNTDFSGQTPSSPEDKTGTWSKRTNRLLNVKSTSVDSIPSYTLQSPADSTSTRAVETQADTSDDNRKKKRFFGGILGR